MIKQHSLKTTYIGITVVAVLVGLLLAFIVTNQSPVSKPTSNFQALAQTLVETCEDASYRPTCYDDNIPTLLDDGLSMEEVFEVTKIVQTLDESYQYCHVLGHLVAAKETARNPEDWKNVIARAPLGVCSNGAIHGAFQERFRVESFAGMPPEAVVAEIKGICDARPEWQPTPIGRATCVHALGHLTMYVTDAEIHDALALCDDLIPLEGDNDTLRQLCYDGAFMQIYQPLEPDDFALIYGKEIETQEESVAFCKHFTGSQYGSCVSESWPLYVDEITVPESIAVVCDRVEPGGWQHERCMSGMFYVTMARANLNVDWALDFCSRVSAEYRDVCFANTTTRLIETDERNVAKSLQLCHRAGQVDAAEACYDELVKFSSYVLPTDSAAFIELCTGMPEPWNMSCLRQGT